MRINWQLKGFYSKFAAWWTILILALVPSARIMQSFSRELMAIPWLRYPLGSLCAASALIALALYAWRLYRVLDFWKFNLQVLALLVISYLSVAQVHLAIEYWHILIYSILAALMVMAGHEHQRRHPFAIALLLSLAVSFADEGLQGLDPERFYDLRDVLINQLSAVLGAVVIWPWANRKSKQY